MAQCNNAWGGREDALLQQKLEQCEALYDSLIAEKAHNSRLQAEIARHKQRADAAERGTAALQRELQARQAENPADGYSSCEVMMLQKKLEKRSAELDLLQQEVSQLQQQLQEMTHRAEDSEAAAAAYRQEYLRLYQQLATSLSIRHPDEGADLDHNLPASTDLAARLASLYHDHNGSLSGSSRSDGSLRSDRLSGSSRSYRSSLLDTDRSSHSSTPGRSVGHSCGRSSGHSSGHCSGRRSGHSMDAVGPGTAERELPQQQHHMAAVEAAAAAAAKHEAGLPAPAAGPSERSVATAVQRASVVTYCASGSSATEPLSSLAKAPAAAAAEGRGPAEPVIAGTAGTQQGCRDYCIQSGTTAAHPPTTPSTVAAAAAAAVAAGVLQRTPNTWPATSVGDYIPRSKIPLPPPVATAEPVVDCRNAAIERPRRSAVRSSMRASLSMSPELVFVWRSIRDDD